jgi:Transposase
VESFEQFFSLVGAPLSKKIDYVCSDMWKPFLRVMRERCSNAVHILDRFHIVAKMNKALDEVRAGEARRLAQDGRLRHEFVPHGIRVLVAVTEEKGIVGRQLGVHPRQIENGVDLAYQMIRRDGIAPRPPGRPRCTRRRNAQIRDEI